MKPAEIPVNEKERLDSLRQYSILDSLPENEYDDITRIASQICRMPVSLISLIDDNRQWFKSKRGIDAQETSREDAFCAHAILNPVEAMVVPDSRKDERFHDNPFVTGSDNIIFYAGVPLVNPEGFALGTLCVIDHKPNVLDAEQLKALKALSKQVVTLLELRKHKYLLEESRKELELKNNELDRFAYVAAHDLKSPLNSITGFSNLLLKHYATGLENEPRKMITYINSSAKSLTELITGILDHSRSDSWIKESKTLIPLDVFFPELVQLLDAENTHQIRYPFTETSVLTNKTALQQVFINLISNSIKYNDKETVIIDMTFAESDSHYLFSVRDNGKGIKAEARDRVFDIFHVDEAKDRFGKRGNGIGLATVKKIVEGLNGTIRVESEPGVYTMFEFSIAK